MLLTPTMSSFVDYQNKTVDFQNEEMKKYLQMAAEFGVEKIQDYFPKGYTQEQMEKKIRELLEKYKMQWQHKQQER